MEIKNAFTSPWVSIYVKGFTDIPATSVIKKSLNPIWDETFSLIVIDSELTSVDIIFRIMDRDMFSDDFMGQSVVYLTKRDFPAFNVFKTYGLNLTGVDRGVLHVSIGIFRE